MLLSSILKLDKEAKCPDKESDKNIGKVFSGDFEEYIVKKKIGSGGIGTVYFVKPQSNNYQKYAMKIVPAEENIRKEKEVLKIALKSNSVHLCKIVDSGYDHELHFIVIDLLGSNLFTFSHQCSRKMNYKLAEQCLIEIEAFHSLGYIHRDIKVSLL
uniref:Protein kinase domain-containing protein n=1 Tax=Panagrolaimus sp. PS1159 TaxID=55785 RepID=A0AC35F2F0_9BILA